MTLIDSYPTPSKASARECSPTEQYLGRHFILFSRRTFAGARFAERSAVAERLAVELSLATIFKDLFNKSVANGDRTPISRMRGERSTTTPLRRSNNLGLLLRLLCYATCQ